MGDIYKIGLIKEGVYKIDGTFLTALGLGANIPSSSIRLYGKGGGMLNESGGADYTDDLPENAIEVVDGGDGIFNAGDYFLFYAAGPQHWAKDSINKKFTHQKNLYTDTAYYYITVGGTGKRITSNTFQGTATTQITSYDERYFYENDLVNILNSGKEWYGELFGNVPGSGLTKTFNVNFPGLLTNSPIIINTSVAGRSVGVGSSFSVTAGTGQIQSMGMSPVSGSTLDLFATTATQQNSFFANQESLAITLNFNPGVSTAQGWLNWFELFCRKSLNMNGQSQIFFRDWTSVSNNNIGNFNIGGTQSTTTVWEITNPLSPQKISLNFNSGQSNFINDASRLREYIAFNNSGYLIPISLGKIVNQNLHSSISADYLIITNPIFINDAQRLAAFHRQYYNNNVVVVTTDQIFNEFSGGNSDPTALRDFVKMYYDKAGSDSTKRPKYLLLFGAGSYDYRYRITGNTNLVPAYESISSLDPLNTYTSDDFFALLDDGDDVNQTSPPGQLDIGVGRIPAITVDDAKRMVDKIIQYHSSASLGAWRNETVFVADDKDNDLHLNDAEFVSGDAAATNNLYNQNKIYLDAYPLISSTGGGRYPAVNDAIVNQLTSGTLIFNYTGHGGYQRLADEAVYSQTELNQISNSSKLPLFITATCDFAPYDDPTKQSIGLVTLTGNSNGAIALMTTTRLVFAYSNKIINDNYLKIALQQDASGKYLTLGEALKRSKNYTYQTFNDVVNNRKFTLLGDPAIQLAFPHFNLQLTTLNNQPLSGNDTLKALGKYTFAGKVVDGAGNAIPNFNGRVYVTVFDKARQISTLGNDPASSITTFSLQKDILYKGKDTIAAGMFSFTFIVPKDINYQIGKGRISLYAENGIDDAAGVNNTVNIGSSINVALPDTVGPVIRLFLNDENFRSGGLTNETPILIADLYDTSGINATGIGIGHDITAILDGDNTNPFILNAYYQAAFNSYTTGRVIYQLPMLSEGNHTLTFKAWDVNNNSGEASLIFRVMKSNVLRINNLFNYPNPFAGKTRFSFEHNQPNTDLKVSIEIYSPDGKLIDIINQTVNTPGTRCTEIEWAGTTKSNEKIASGVYIYRIIVTSKNGTVTAAQKLYFH
ncbi:type IX secretion system sortase PorU [Chitinophagaceae bacterium LWZ2-11]